MLDRPGGVFVRRADLLKPEYKGQIALDGDPRTSNQAIQAVYAAALANGGSLDNAQPGLDFFKKVVDAGNFVPTDANPGTIVQGATPVALRWSYNGLAHRDETADNPTIDVTVPASGRFGGVYVQAISKYAPHPNAAKLFIDTVLSKEGQELIKSFSRIPDRSDVPSELKEGIKFFPADPRWGDSYGKYVEEFREIFLK